MNASYIRDAAATLQKLGSATPQRVHFRRISSRLSRPQFRTSLVCCQTPNTTRVRVCLLVVKKVSLVSLASGC